MMVKRDTFSSSNFLRRTVRAGVFALTVTLGAGSLVLAHTPNVDSSLADWCVGATSNTAPGGGRVENSAVQLTCGNCSVSTNRACRLNSDCPGAETCVNLTSKTEVAWWDNRTDGAVNDLGTVAMTQNATNLYIAAELWVDPDPVSLPFGEIAIDFKSGGVGAWHDPNGLMKTPGRCSQFTDRGCTSNADCAFCQISDEPTGGCSVTTTKSCVTNTQCPGGETCIHRVRPCGSACDPNIGDVCNQTQTCVGIGAGGSKIGIGSHASPEGKPEYILLFDFSYWLVGAGDAVQLMRPRTAADPVDPTTPWVPVTGCTPDFAGDTTVCDFPPAVNPGASGGSGGPPGSIEVAIPWTAFAGSGFGPGVPFRFTMTIARGSLTIDFKPDGAQEDVLSESVAQASSTTTSSCPGMGIATTFCELEDGSSDAFLPRTPVLQNEVPAGGRISSLTVNKSGASLALNWFPSCSAADNNYEVQEGALGTWYSHVPVTCATGGTTATFAPAAGNRYYLVVPTNGATEGSYGKNSASVERPVSTSACLPQSLGTCP
jgi:hypothetical protein